MEVHAFAFLQVGNHIKEIRACGLPFGPSIRIRPFASFPVNVPSASKPVGVLPQLPRQFGGVDHPLREGGHDAVQGETERQLGLV